MHISKFQVSLHAKRQGFSISIYSDASAAAVCVLPATESHRVLYGNGLYTIVRLIDCYILYICIYTLCTHSVFGSIQVFCSSSPGPGRRWGRAAAECVQICIWHLWHRRRRRLRHISAFRNYETWMRWSSGNLFN